jgi:hypothetical protein
MAPTLLRAYINKRDLKCGMPLAMGILSGISHYSSSTAGKPEHEKHDKNGHDSYLTVAARRVAASIIFMCIKLAGVQPYMAYAPSSPSPTPSATPGAPAASAELFSYLNSSVPAPPGEGSRYSGSTLPGTLEQAGYVVEGPAAPSDSVELFNYLDGAVGVSPSPTHSFSTGSGPVLEWAWDGFSWIPRDELPQNGLLDSDALPDPLIHPYPTWSVVDDPAWGVPDTRADT